MPYTPTRLVPPTLIHRALEVRQQVSPRLVQVGVSVALLLLLFYTVRARQRLESRQRLDAYTTCKTCSLPCCMRPTLCVKGPHVPLRVPISESLERLSKEDLQKFAQYLISSTEISQKVRVVHQSSIPLLHARSHVSRTRSHAPECTCICVQ